MNRRSLTLLTVASLYGTYRLYAAVVSPLTAPEVLHIQQVQTGEDVEIEPLPITGRVARQYLAEEAWARDAKYQWQRGDETFLYFQKQRRIDDDMQNKMRVTPFALVWFDRRRDEEVVYTLVCSSAEIEFESKFQFGQSNPGRIVGGQLQGEVRLTGPDHLRIVGKNFSLSEKDQRLYSDYPVSFAYGPQPGRFEQVRGRADSVDITLKDQRDSLLGHDMPRISGLRKVTLRRDVLMHLVMDENGEAAPVAIACDRQFTYDVDDLVATFEENVFVERPTQAAELSERWDRLRCDHLTLSFEDQQEVAARSLAEAAGAASATGDVIPVSAAPLRERRDTHRFINLDLAFRSLRAIGREVLLQSEEHELTARMQDLHYDAVTRTIDMRDETRPVEVNHRHDKLLCPVVRLTHDEGRIVTAQCQGAGRIMRRSPETSEIEFESTWTESLRLAPAENPHWDRLEITGDGHLVQRLRRTGIIADTLTVWLDSRSMQAADENLRSARSTADPDDGLPVKKVIASSNVALVSPTLHLETQRLEADFITEDLVASAAATSVADSPAAEGSSSPLTLTAPESTHAERTRQPVSVAAESVVVQLIYDPAQETTDLRRLDAATNVSVTRARRASAEGRDERADDPFSVESDEMTLINRGGRHVLRLIGSPARVRHPEAEIEGRTIDLDRGSNEAVVEGAGALTMLVETDLQGRPLEDHQRHLIIRWEERMHFDGQSATFLQDVRTTLADSMMRSQKMTVVLNRRLSFADDRPQTDRLEINRVHCENGVTGAFRDWEGTRLIGLRQFGLDEFVMERATGNFRGRGPGKIHDWSRSGRQRRVRIDSLTTSNANQPLHNDQQLWDYTHVEFAGTVSGNHRDRYVELSERVRVMHGPVENARAILERDEFSQAPERVKNAIFIGSDKLRVSLVDGPLEGGETAQVIAWGNAELEGLEFGGRAHSVSYDESKGMFTLKGRGSEAYLWHQDQPGARFNETEAKTIQFVPAKNELLLDGTRRTRAGR